MSDKKQKIVGVKRSPDQIEQLVACRNALFGIRLRQYHVESCIESRVDPVLEIVFLDLEREWPHFIVELGTALVLILVVHVLQDVAVMTRREHQNAGLHDVFSAPGESPELVIILRIEIGLPEPCQRGIAAFRVLDHSAPECLMGIDALKNELVDRSYFIDRDGGSN